MATADDGCRLTTGQALQKRTFDLLLSITGLLLFSWVIVLAILAARWDTGLSGLYRQQRIGRDGHPFMILKIRTMRDDPTFNTTVTVADDKRITPLGRFFRKTKIDELPQLINVLTGDMSFVGPRPDVPGFADQLTGEDRCILNIRPGITGPASLAYRNEEQLLADVDDPVVYNREVLFPDKVRINKDYIRQYSLWNDITFILKTLF